MQSNFATSADMFTVKRTEGIAQMMMHTVLKKFEDAKKTLVIQASVFLHLRRIPIF